MSKTFHVVQNPELGRYGIAGKNLTAGELLFEEMPFAIGPKADSLPICLECHCPVDGGKNGPKCPICFWPLCEDCSVNIGSLVYHAKECVVFANSNVKFQNVEDSTASCLQLDCITPLRILLEKEVNPERWNAEICEMEHHEERRRDTPSWNSDANNVVKYLRGPCGLDERFSEDLIQQAIGILEVNAFEGRTSSGYSIRCVYPKLAVMAHCCVPNIIHSIFPSDGFRMTARVTVDVSEGQKLCTTYTYIMNGTSARQAALKDGKYFTCHCERCVDPTELGTHFSSFICTRCDMGFIISSEPLNDDAQWKCIHCDFKTSGQAIQKAVQVMQNELDELQYLEHGSERLEQFERAFRKYRSILHPKHFILTSIRHSLMELYGRIPGYELQDLPEILLERKEDLCRDVIKVLDVFEPGMSRSRAMLLYELHAPLVLLAKIGFSTGILSGDPLKIKLQEAVDMLQESAAILQWEDPTTPEGILGRVATQSLNQLKQSIDSLE